eukprot:1892072-Prymnesium_polylepis.2
MQRTRSSLSPPCVGHSGRSGELARRVAGRTASLVQKSRAGSGETSAHLVVSSPGEDARLAVLTTSARDAERVGAASGERAGPALCQLVDKVQRQRERLARAPQRDRYTKALGAYRRGVWRDAPDRPARAGGARERDGVAMTHHVIDECLWQVEERKHFSTAWHEESRAPVRDALDEHLEPV